MPLVDCDEVVSELGAWGSKSLQNLAVDGHHMILRTECKTVLCLMAVPGFLELFTGRNQI